MRRFTYKTGGVKSIFHVGKIAEMDTAVNAATAMQAIIDARVEAIRQAHANNLIENLDMGEEVFQAMLQRAREPVSNEEFTRREKILLRREFGLQEAA